LRIIVVYVLMNVNHETRVITLGVNTQNEQEALRQLYDPAIISQVQEANIGTNYNVKLRFIDLNGKQARFSFDFEGTFYEFDYFVR
jgi:hypothetical protein